MRYQPWAWACGLRMWAFFFWRITICHNSSIFYLAILCFMSPKFTLGPLIPLWAIWTHSDVFAYFFIFVISERKNIKKILVGPDSKTAEHFQYPYIFPTTVQKFSSKCDGQWAWAFFFLLENTVCRNSAIVYCVISSFMGPKFILGSLMPFREVWTHFDLFAFFFLQFSSVKILKKLAGLDSKTALRFQYSYIFSYHRAKIRL